MDDSEVLGRFGKNASIRILKGEEFPPVPPTEEFQERYAGVRLKEMHYRYPNGSEELFWLREENRKWKVVENVSNKCGYRV